MIKIFIFNDEIVNVDNEIDSKMFKSLGAIEITDKINSDFDNYKHLINNGNTTFTKKENDYNVDINVNKIIDEIKLMKKKEVDIVYNELNKIFIYKNNSFQVDDNSLNLILQRASLPTTQIIDWITSTNEIVQFDFEDFKDFANNCLSYISSLKIKARILKNQIEQANTLEDLKNINTNKGNTDE